VYLVAPEDLGDDLADEPGYRVEQLRRWLYVTPVLTTAAMTNLPLDLRERLAPRHWPFRLETEQVGDAGSTRKWLFRTPDGAAIETVLIGHRRRTTLCISSQVGCAMGCTFCATGLSGFERHLRAGEIVAQVAYAVAALRSQPLPRSPARVTNVVFMGMGEPLANYDNLRKSLRRLIEVMGISARAITVSTVGMVPGIRRLAEEPWNVNLAISLHAVDDETRNLIVPLNRRHPIERLVEAGRAYRERTGRRVSLEWTLIEGRNDTPETAARLAVLARRMRAHVNVIPLNPVRGANARAPEPEAVARFMAALRSHGANATLRVTRGRDIDAACGQLRARRAGPVALQQPRRREDDDAVATG